MWAIHALTRFPFHQTNTTHVSSGHQRTLVSSSIASCEQNVFLAKRKSGWPRERAAGGFKRHTNNSNEVYKSNQINMQRMDHVLENLPSAYSTSRPLRTTPVERHANHTP